MEEISLLEISRSESVPQARIRGMRRHPRTSKAKREFIRRHLITPENVDRYYADDGRMGVGGARLARG